MQAMDLLHKYLSHTECSEWVFEGNEVTVFGKIYQQQP
jgi:hypothetical protein